MTISNLVLNTDLSYWMGLVQSDGYIDNKRHLIKLEVKDRILIDKFQSLSNILFGRNPKVFLRKSRNTYFCTIGIAKLEKKFKNLDLLFKFPNIPHKVAENERLFFAYLGGLIDGDGNVRIRRRRHPQCTIRIINKNDMSNLKHLVECYLNCKASLYTLNKDENSWSVLEFCVSRKNFVKIKEHLLPFILLERKMKILNEFIISKFTLNRDAGVA